MRFVSGYVLPIVEISKAISIIFTSYSPYLVKDAPISRKIFVADLTELSIFVPKIKKVLFSAYYFWKNGHNRDKPPILHNEGCKAQLCVTFVFLDFFPIRLQAAQPFAAPVHKAHKSDGQYY